MTRRKTVAGNKAVQVASVLLSVVLVVTILHLAKVVLLPIALAVLLTFVLTPLVMRLDHAGLGRVPAVLVVVGSVGLLLGALTWVVASQLGSLANELPLYRENIREKVATLAAGTSGGFLQKVQSTLQEATEEAAEEAQQAAAGGVDTTAVADAAGDEQGTPEEELEPVLVRVVDEDAEDRAVDAAVSSLLALSPALGGLATVGLALVLLLFMLIDREDLRNRLVSFTAEGSLATTTKALDDAMQRISRYLIMQLIINGTYGLAVGIGLLVLGVPYASLWGLCAAVFRYIPYLGPWVAALLPLAVSVITSPGWTQALLVLGMFLVLELLSNNIMEPWLYGHGVGISVVALLVSAAFWTWTWGPIGLILATPLTVCLVVIGKYVPALAFLDRLLGDQPALQPYAVFLQRLLARDAEEAAEIVQHYRAEHPPAMVYDGVFLPALYLARQDRSRGTMSAEEETFLLQATEEILTSLTPAEVTPPALTSASGAGEPTGGASEHGTVAGEDGEDAVPHAEGAALRAEGAALPPQALPAITVGQDAQALAAAQPVAKVMGCPAHKEAEELTLRMLDQLIRPAGFPVEVLSTRTLPSDVVKRVKQQQPAVVVIAVLLPGGLVQARYLCRFLRKQFPELGIVVGCWGYKGDLDWVIVKMRSAGADYVTTTLLGAQDHVASLASAKPPRETATAAAQPQAALGV